MPEVVRTDRADEAEVARFDRAPLARATRTDEGFLVAPANLTRTGVLEYLNTDGSIRRELRLDTEVFSAASLATYQGKPVLRGHPNEIGGMLDAHTARGRIVGSVRDVARADDGRHVAGTVTIYDAETIRAVDAGEREISVGYRARLEPIPGGRHRLDDGTEVQADFIQRGIRANHIAIVRRGRAGEGASIRLDAAGHQTVGREPEEQNTMTPEQIAAMQAENARLKAEADASAKARTDSVSDAEKAKAEAAAAKASAAEMQKRLDDYTARDKAAAHKALCARVAPVTGEKADDLVRLDSVEVQRRALAKLTPSLDLKEKAPEFIGAAFETAMSLVRLDSAQTIATAVLGVVPRNDGDDMAKLQKARDEAKQQAADAWKPKAS